MGTKEKLLCLLEENRGRFFSGEEIAERLEVSRTAVWKAAKMLRTEGYQIDAAQNKGYCLAQSTDILSEQGVCRYLAASEIRPEVLAVTSSTNGVVRERANNGETEGLAVIAGAQTKGRGRLGRTFYSPADTGIYMSLLLRPEGFTPAEAIRVTTMAAVAASEAIERVSGRKTQIKWVNDVFMDGKKVCGILTEGSFSLENENLEYMVLGVGMNVYEPEGGFPEELKDIAGSIFDQRQNDGKNRLAAEFMNAFMAYYRERNTEYAEQYRRRSMVLGRAVDVITAGGRRRAWALDVDQDCRLVVRYENGEIVHLSSAEVSIRTV